MRKLYQQDEALRRTNFARMQQVARRIVAEVPAAMLSTDSPGRETDIAIDHSEFTTLAPDSIALVVRLMQEEGMNATVSSIHIKVLATTTSWMAPLDRARAVRPRADAEIGRLAYSGDSTTTREFEQFSQHRMAHTDARAQLSIRPCTSLW